MFLFSSLFCDCFKFARQYAAFLRLINAFALSLSSLSPRPHTTWAYTALLLRICKTKNSKFHNEKVVRVVREGARE